MSNVKRWFMLINARINVAMSQIENQEGMVNIMIEKTHQSVARANVQLKRVEQDGLRLQEQLASARLAAQAWEDRARDCMDKDETRAMECLRRSKVAAKDVADVEQRLHAHDEAEQKLRQDVFIIKKRLAELVEKRNLMRTRQARAEAFQTAQCGIDDAMSDIEDIFDRWETKVTLAEQLGGFESDKDAFEAAYLEEEEQAALREELYALRTQNDATP